MEELLALLGIGSGGLLLGDVMGQLTDIGDQAMTGSADIGNQAVDMSDFKGFGITGPGGTGSTDEFGNTTFSLGSRGTGMQNLFNQAMQDVMGDSALGNYANNALGTANNMLSSIGGDPGAREADIYERLRAVQRPEEERRGLGLESRAASQGRLGVRTAMYGGSPEQFAHQQAIAEAQNTAAANAIGLAQQQQMQDAQIGTSLANTGYAGLSTQGQLGTMFGQSSFLPTQMLMDQYNTGLQGYSFEDIARRQGSTMFSEANMGGLEALLGTGLGQANLMGQIGSGLLTGGLGALGQIFNAGGSWLDIF